MSEVDNVRPRLIVADPDPEASALLSRQLEWAGYDVTTAGNGRDALDLICRLKPAAAVLEVKMDILTGYEVVRRMRDDDRSRLVPVVMISARAGKLDRDFAFTVGADDYVKKPFRSAELIARLALLAPSPHAPKKPQLEPVPDPMPVAHAPSPIARPRRALAPLALAR